MVETDEPAATGAPRSRIVHRLPVRLRQHWKLLALFVAVTVGLTAVFGQSRIRPYISGDVSVITSEITENIAGTVDLFDPAVSHTLTVDISPQEYDEMISAYQKDGDKKWVTADVVIDGVTISDAAVRLKGNSTLAGLGGPGGPQRPGGGDFQPPSDAGAMSAVASASADDPTSLPLLLSFDENAEGRGYQGMTELSIRPGTPVLNESLALALTASTGQPSQAYAYATYTINGQTTTRLLLQHPDESYANSLFDSDGYLYKADASSRLEFLGTDQSEYADQFKQINAVDSGNLQPLINLLEWLDGASAEEFDAELSEWVEVESLARYVATQNLLANGDDMGGPGQNYYLWYDLTTEKFTVVSWDLNLAMQGDAAGGPDDAVQMGPPAGTGDADGPPGGEGAAPPSFGDEDGAGPKIGNQLKTRFLESEAFSQLYHETYWELYDQMYADGRANTLLDEIASTVPITDGLSEQELADAVDSMHQWIDQRVAALELLRGE